MTYRVRHRFLRRLALCWQFLRKPAVDLDRLLTLEPALLRRNRSRVDGDMRTLGREAFGGKLAHMQAPVADDLAKFAELKRRLAELVRVKRAELENKDETNLVDRMGELVVEVELANHRAGWRPEPMRAEAMDFAELVQDARAST